MRLVHKRFRYYIYEVSRSTKNHQARRSRDLHVTLVLNSEIWPSPAPALDERRLNLLSKPYLERIISLLSNTCKFQYKLSGMTEPVSGLKIRNYSEPSLRP